jgi:hypothetical protein
MTMTVGTGPFGHRPAGRLNFVVPWEGHPVSGGVSAPILALARGEVVVGSVNVHTLYEQHRLSVWCFPLDDVRLDALASDTRIYERTGAKGLVGVRWNGGPLA